jgi:hypothetical protein
VDFNLSPQTGLSTRFPRLYPLDSRAGVFRAEFRRVAFGQRVDEFLMEIVEARGDRRRDSSAISFGLY